MYVNGSLISEMWSDFTFSLGIWKKPGFFVCLCVCVLNFWTLFHERVASIAPAVNPLSFP